MPKFRIITEAELMVYRHYLVEAESSDQAYSMWLEGKVNRHHEEVSEALSEIVMTIRAEPDWPDSNFGR